MYWRYGRPSSLPGLIKQLLSLFRQLLVIFDGDVEQSLDQLEDIGNRYRLWREGFGPEEFRKLIQQRGEARRGRSGQLELTRKGERALRRQMLQDVFAKLLAKGRGDHRTPYSGGAGEPTDETRPYAFGDTTDLLDVGRTLSNWLGRTGGEGDLAEQDLEVGARAVTCL